MKIRIHMVYAMSVYMPNLAHFLLNLPRLVKRLVVLSLDFGLCILTVWLAYYLRLGEFIIISGEALLPLVASISIALPIFIMSGMYRAIFRYSGWPALLAVARAISIYGLLYGSLFTAIGVTGVPRTLGIIQPILLLLFVGGSRAIARFWLVDQYYRTKKHISRPKVLVYGAGNAGRQLVAAITNSREMEVLGFLDDDVQLRNQLLNGQIIYNPSDLEKLVATLEISHVILAMPNISRNRRNEILTKISGVRVAVRSLPSLTGLMQGKVSISDLHELDIDDLLGREPVIPNHKLLAMNVQSKVVMVTGAGGSIGSELCRQILDLNPSKLLLIEQNEFALYSIHHELEKMSADRKITIVPLIASIRDVKRIHEIMSTWGPNTVYHAAAFKHVPMVEHNFAEGLKNNVFGTLRLAQTAIQNGVSDFVFISTDKAVRPTNVMGASKRLAEMVLQAIAATKLDTKFTMVRFGNVLDSSGSVVPRFRQQIRAGGPITLTHSEITRYFMTISEAAQLVIQSGAMAKGGDVFVLDMGQPVKIMDLAKRMVELSGLTIRDEQNPEGDIEIKIIGLRPGEKLYEELLIGDNPKATAHPRIMKANEDFTSWLELKDKLQALEMALDVNDISLIRLMMEKLVIGYAPVDEIVDWVYLEQRARVPTVTG